MRAGIAVHACSPETLLLTQPCCSPMTASWDWIFLLGGTLLMVTTQATRRSVPPPSTSEPPWKLDPEASVLQCCTTVLIKQFAVHVTLQSVHQRVL